MVKIKQPIPLNDGKEEKPLRIGICAPLYSHVPSQFLLSIVRMINVYSKKYIIDTFFDLSFPLDRARNELCRQAVEKELDYVLFLDADNLMPEQGLDMLIKDFEDARQRGEKVGYVSGLYFSKSEPHYPVLREYHDGGYWNVEDLEMGKVIEVDGAGMGCCLIDPKLFTDVDYPWFKFSYEEWYGREIQLSEDLWFSRKLKEKGYKMYCDTRLIVGHVGGITTGWHSEVFSQLRKMSKEERLEIERDIMDFQKEDLKTVRKRMMTGTSEMAKDWNEKNPQTDEEITKYYKETDWYIYDLTNWHFNTRRKFDLDFTAAVINSKPKNILDLGCGIGQNAFMLAKGGMDVTLADLDSVSLSFATHRFQKHNIPYKLWKTDIEETPIDTKFDIILFFDVAEHLPIKELEKVVEKLIKLKHSTTKVFTTQNFGKTKTYPMHYELDPERDKLMRRLLSEHGQ